MKYPEMNDIIRQWSNGEITLEECNEKLEPYGIAMDPSRLVMTEEEAAKPNPDISKINGMGWLDTQSGSYDKEMIVNGKTVDDMGTVAHYTIVVGYVRYDIVNGNELANPRLDRKQFEIEE